MDKREPIIWIPITGLGKRVLSNEYSSLSCILKEKIKIKDPKVVDFFLKDLKIHKVLVETVQRTLTSGKQKSFRALIAIGDGINIFGLGFGKSKDKRDSINKGIFNAKKNLILIKKGCGSISCDKNCKYEHSLINPLKGVSGSTEVFLDPAPRGTGIVANYNATEIMKICGIKDIRIKVNPKTSSELLNYSKAIYNALKEYYDCNY